MGLNLKKNKYFLNMIRIHFIWNRKELLDKKISEGDIVETFDDTFKEEIGILVETLTRLCRVFVLTGERKNTLCVFSKESIVKSNIKVTIKNI
jgi:hypothetical protein